MAATLPPSPPVAADSVREVAVVGAGLVGLCSALWLQRLGHSVTLIDSEPPLPGSSYENATSFGNACTVAPHAVIPVATPGIGRRVPAMLANPEGPLAIMWPYLPRLAPWLRGFLASSTPDEMERIGGILRGLLDLADAGYQPLYEDARVNHLLRHAGCLYLFKTEAEHAAAREDTIFRERHGVRMDHLDSNAIRDLEPNLAPLYHRGLLFRDAYTFDTPKAVAFAFAQAFLGHGGTIVAGRVRALSPTPQGIRIALEGADDHLAERAVIAAGSWSRPLAKSIGDDVLLDTERGYHVLFPEGGNLLNRPVCYAEHGFYMTPTSEGLRAAGTVELGGLTAPARTVRTRAIRKAVAKLVPRAGEGTREWLGFRPSMPDSLPVIGQSPSDLRVIYAFGHGHIGLTLAGITGRLVADLLSGRPTPIDMGPLRPVRFGAFGRPLPGR
ncbi:D-amino-acid dehydrogenase [Rhodoligotrophos appendicifer]|uniref:NAD(P)/FAD-dependent oxidoreductase n=1 Tax=Rhodoligotrophos appendicifer TaxID=987056 RepID=UPI00117CD788|nr:FAD-binding oxidoreductase [Rhodoligotrophos appendicifer]